jgi:hypothetical protein
VLLGMLLCSMCMLLPWCCQMSAAAYVQHQIAVSSVSSHLRRELSHPNVVVTYDFGWIDHEVNSLLSVRPEAAAMVILMEFCNLKSLATNIYHTNRFGHYQVRLRDEGFTSMPANLEVAQFRS